MPKGTGRSKAVGWRKTSPTNTEDGGTGELCDLRPGVSEQEESSGTTYLPINGLILHRYVASLDVWAPDSKVSKSTREN